MAAAAIAFSSEQASQDYPSRHSAVCVVTFKDCGDQPHRLNAPTESETWEGL